MKIQFLCRFEKKRPQEDIDQEKINIELGIDYEPYIKEYEYDVLVQDSDNIVAFNPVNSKNVALRTKVGEIFIVKGNIDTLLQRWTEITGEVISKCY